MSRYIDADELKKQIDLVQMYVTGGRLQGKLLLNETMEIYKKAILKKIDEQPTADVVPKSEVEMLQGALKAEERHNELTMDMAKKALANAKADVAREIFAEIDRMCIDTFGNFNHRVFSELKKKYTEGE